MSDKPKLLHAESQRFAAEAIKALSTHFQVQLADLERDELLRQVRDCQVLWVRLRHRVDRELLAQATRLRAVVTNTTGLNHIDVPALEERGIRLISLKGEGDFLRTIRATAELTIALTLALLRKIPQAHQHVLTGGWNRDLFVGREIFEKTVGIVGYGRLGQIAARYFQAFGAKVLVCSPEFSIGSKVDGLPVVELAELLAESDIVSLHASYEPANHNLIGAAQFAVMKPGAILINTARGELTDELAMLQALQSGKLAGAGLDVIVAEQSTRDHLESLVAYARQNDTLLITPHIGGNTVDSTRRTELFLAERLCTLWPSLPGNAGNFSIDQGVQDHEHIADLN